MTNFEYWKDEILAIANSGYTVAINKNTNKPTHCRNSEIICRDCVCDGEQYCSIKRFKWLYAEHVDEPTLTKKERMFCELVGTGYIARDGDGRIFYYKHMPVRYDSSISGKYWASIEQDMTLNIRVIDCLQNGFEFVKATDEEPWDVEELLKLEVREEKDN